MFSIDELIRIWHVGIIKPYFDKIKDADSDSLRRFKKEIIKHRKNSKRIQAFADINDYTIHDVLISAVKHELLKRSRFIKIYLKLIPIRKWIAQKMGAKELIYKEEIGIIFKPIKTQSFFYKPISQHLLELRRFWLRHWKWIITTVIAIMVLVVLILNYLRNRP